MTVVEITARAEEHIEDLESETRERVLKKLNEARDWTEHRLDPLSGYPYYKLRVGEYRVIVTWNRGAEEIIVEAVGHRRNVYDRHLPP
jgi:mRNA interferase RelE/StbE